MAIAVTVQRQTFLSGTGISPYEAQLAFISEKAVRGFAVYGQVGYTTRNQPFQGLGIRRSIGERLVVSGNYSYRNGKVFGETTPSLSNSHPTSAVAYATAYYSVSGRLGLTAAAGRSFPSQTDSGGFTRFFSFGFGYAIKR
jgi:outer membrane scaffolding protein for murein synthesis (MipA/OmpV family)